MPGEFHASVPGQRFHQMLRHRANRRRERRRNRVWVSRNGKMNQNTEPGAAFHERRDLGAVSPADDEIAFPMPNHLTIVCFGWTFSNTNQCGNSSNDPRIPGSLLAWPAKGPPSPQPVAVVPGQAAAGSKHGPVNALRADPHRRLVREIPAQHVADLLRRPAPSEPVLNITAKSRVHGELRRSRAKQPAFSTELRQPRVIPFLRPRIAGQLTTDSRRRTPNQPRDLHLGQPLPTADRDRDSVHRREKSARRRKQQMSWHHPSSLTDQQLPIRQTHARPFSSDQSPRALRNLAPEPNTTNPKNRHQRRPHTRSKLQRPRESALSLFTSSEQQGLGFRGAVG